MRTKLNPKIN